MIWELIGNMCANLPVHKIVEFYLHLGVLKFSAKDDSLKKKKITVTSNEVVFLVLYNLRERCYKTVIY